MSASRTYGIPDIELPMPTGRPINPSDFAGHELVVLFCPLDRDAAQRELAAYDRHADQLSYNDGWMIAVGGAGDVEPASRIILASEPDSSAWQAFAEILDPPQQLPRKDGAVFLFGRGGCLTRGWPGAGHAGEVASELGKRM